jgi:hypothetical protein
LHLTLGATSNNKWDIHSMNITERSFIIRFSMFLKNAYMKTSMCSIYMLDNKL